MGLRADRLQMCAVLALALGASPAGPSRAGVVFESQLPAPNVAGGLLSQTYLIGPQDELNVVVFQDKDLSQTIVVDNSGHIVLPLVGPLLAAGKTPESLAVEIAAKLKEKYFQDPQVAVSVTKAISQKITVEGEVAKPGVYQIAGRTTLVQAIALAGGAGQYADYKHVVVFRSIDNQPHAAMFNLDDTNRGRSLDPEIYKDDVIVVERSGVKTIFRDYLTPISPLIYLIPQFVR